MSIETVWIYGEVGEFASVKPRKFIEEIANSRADTIVVRINSPGGSVFDGLAIHDALKRHPARIEVDIDGQAASITSVIAMAGDHIRIAPSGHVMIHQPWTATAGTAGDMRKTAAQLDDAEDVLIGIYERRSGQSQSRISGWLAAETRFFANEAVELGFADEVAYSTPLAPANATSTATRTSTAPTDGLDWEALADEERRIRRLAQPIPPTPIRKSNGDVEDLAAEYRRINYKRTTSYTDAILKKGADLQWKAKLASYRAELDHEERKRTLARILAGGH